MTLIAATTKNLSAHQLHQLNLLKARITVLAQILAACKQEELQALCLPRGHLATSLHTVSII